MSEGPALIKDNLALSTFIGRYTKLVRKGNRWAACCPLHKEKTPSFYIDDNKGYFHCFGCGKGGDVIKFCMEMENMEFREALEFLADIAGIDLPKAGKPGPSRDLVEKLRALNEEAVNFYQAQLRKTKSAQAYLEERGISESTARLFRLGYAPAMWDGLLSRLGDKYSPDLLLKSGLVKKGKSGNPYDLFRDRIMFPIRDVQGRTIAFGGRLFGEAEGPKYINSPETPLYIKGKHVYNMDAAKNFVKKDPEKGVLVVEGYMDVIQLYQAGVHNVIAGLGTAFTQPQGKLLKRYTKRILINYDADNAGFKAARAAIEIFLGLDLDIRVLTLPHKQDPDDFIRDSGLEAYQQRMVEAEDFFKYLLRYLGEGKDLQADPRQRSAVAGEMVKVIGIMEDPVLRNHYLEQLSTHLALPIHVIQELQAEQKSKKKVPSHQRRKAPSAPGPGAAPEHKIKAVAPRPIKKSRAVPASPDFAPPPAPSFAPPPAPSFGPPANQSSEPAKPQPATPKAEPQQAPAETPVPVVEEQAMPEAPPLPTVEDDASMPDGPPPMLDDDMPIYEPSMEDLAASDDMMTGFDMGIPDEMPREQAPPPPDHWQPSESYGQGQGNAFPSGPRRSGGNNQWQGRKNNWKGKGKGKWKGKGRWERDPADDIPPRPDLKPSLFTKVEEEFLYQAMHVPDFNMCLSSEHQDLMPRILASVFADRRWVLDFVYAKDETFEERMEMVPIEHHGVIMQINFNEAYEVEDKERLQQLVPEMLRSMLDKLADLNRQRMLALPPHENERKKALMRANNELRRQRNRI